MRLRTLQPVLGLSVSATWLASAAIAAAPSAPPGWTRDSSGDIQIYRSEESGLSAELRVFPPQRMSADLSAWFDDRLASPVPGVTAVRFERATRLKSEALLATGAGTDAQGRRVYLLRMGCRRAQGDAVYAESVVSSDERFFRSVAPQTADIFGHACLDPTSEVAQTPPRPEAPPSTKASPAKAKATAAPFPYVKAPGTGLKATDVEAVLSEWRNEHAGMTMQVNTYRYLLLKDGSYRSDLPPVALEDFDAAASRQGEPKRWGRWTRSGGSYLLTEASGSRQKFNAGDVREPARRDEKLEGRWGADSAYSTMWSVSRSHHEISFERGGRFSQSSGGSVVGGAGSTAAGTAVAVSVVRDDDGSSASVGGANFGGGSSHQRASTLPDRSGTYRLDGYTIELHYDSGRVERLTFSATADRNEIALGDDEMSRVKPKGR